MSLLLLSLEDFLFLLLGKNSVAQCLKHILQDSYLMSLCHGLAPAGNKEPCCHSLAPLPWWDGEENQKTKANLVLG